MRFRCQLPLAVALVAAASLAGAAPRRAVPASSHGSQGPSADLYGGYSYTRAGEAGLHGWGLAGSVPFRGSLSLVADLSGHSGSFGLADLSQLSLMAGVRRTWRSHALRPFAEGLIGMVRTKTTVPSVSLSESGTDAALALGGGVDYRLTSRWAARGLVHLRLVRGDGAWDTDPRLSLGVVYRFGR